MIVDIHNHADYHGYNVEKTLENMDARGIDVTCLLSWEAQKNDYDPANIRKFSPFSEKPIPFERCAAYKEAAPDRFLLGYCPDPRQPTQLTG